MHTSREANKAATPMGMKIMPTSMNAEITCTGEERLHEMVSFPIYDDKITQVL